MSRVDSRLGITARVVIGRDRLHARLRWVDKETMWTIRTETKDGYNVKKCPTVNDIRNGLSEILKSLVDKPDHNITVIVAYRKPPVPPNQPKK